MTLTIFVPLMEGQYDNEYGPHVYEGRLTKEQALEVGRKLGDAYAAVAIEGSDEHGWYVSYNESAEAEPKETPIGTSYLDTSGCGALSYSVEYRELNAGA